MSSIKNSEFYAHFKGTEILKQVKHQMMDHGFHTTSRCPCQSPMSSVTCMRAYTRVWLGTSTEAGFYLYKGQKQWLIFVRTARSVKTPPLNCSTSQGFPTPKLAMPVLARAHLYCQEGSVPRWISFPFIFKWLFWYEQCWICTRKSKIEA